MFKGILAVVVFWTGLITALTFLVVFPKIVVALISILGVAFLSFVILSLLVEFSKDIYEDYKD